MNYPYANGIIKAIENKILDLSKLQRLNNLSKKDFLKALIDLDYGNSQATTLEQLINLELKKTKNMLLEISPQKKLTELFYFQHDATNIKAFYKRKLFNIIQFNIFVELGTIPYKLLEEVIINENLTILKGPLKSLFQRINKQIENLDSPRLVSARIDREIYRYLFKQTNNKALITYFKAKVDFANILTLLRSLKLKWNIDEFLEMFLEGGQISKEIFIKIFTEREGAISQSLTSFYDEKISQGLIVYETNQDLNQLEKYFDEFILGIMKTFSFDSFDIGPIIYYYLLKQAEAQNLRIIYSQDDDNVDALIMY